MKKLASGHLVTNMAVTVRNASRGNDMSNDIGDAKVNHVRKIKRF